MAVFAVLFGVVWMLWSRSRRFEHILSSNATAQYQVRRAFLRLLQDVQQAIDIVLPGDGYTQPFLVLKDQENRVVTYYLTKNADASAREGVAIHDLMRKIPEYPATGQPAKDERVISDVVRMTFTAIGAGGVMLNLLVRVEGRDFPLVSMVRLKALSSLEPL